MTRRKKALGKGLGALLDARPVPIDEEASPQELPPEERDQLLFLNIEDIFPNPYQPRQHFSQESLRELADSIKAHGVLQPLLVIRKDDSEDDYYLLAGERRFRASQLAGLTKVPVRVTEATEENMLAIALVENLQREDLNPVEEARAYSRLLSSFNWTQEQVAQRVGKNRVTVANALRLLKLSGQALADLEDGRLTAGHARTLLMISDTGQQEKLRKEIVEGGISVREAERRATEWATPKPPLDPQKKPIKLQQGLDTVDFQERLMQHLGCRVKVRSRNGKTGKIEIPFNSPDELDRFLQAVGFEMDE